MRQDAVPNCSGAETPLVVTAGTAFRPRTSSHHALRRSHCVTLRAMQNTPALFRLDGKIALVTGAATGIGAAIATGLAQAGATVACHGNRRAATQTAEAIGGNAAAFQADLSSTDGAAKLFSEVTAKLGRIDILVNNAGMILRDAAEDFSLEAWQQVL